MSSNEADTKPTLETVLERIADFRTSVEARFEGVDARFEGIEARLGGIETRFGGIESRFEGIETRLDRLESLAYLTKSEMADLRLEFREWRKELKEHLPATS